MCRKMFQGRAVVRTLLLLVSMTLGQMAGAQDTITISFGCAQVAVGDQICVPVYADGFTNVTVFSMLLTWDPLILNFTGLQNEAFPLQGAWNAPGPSDLRYIWNDPNGNGQDLPDGSILFEMCFQAIGPVGSSSLIGIPPFVLNPFNTTEFADPDVELIPYVEIPCTVEIINPVTVLAIIDVCGSPDGVADGSFTITGAGGTPPYSYSWTGPANGNSTLSAAGVSESQSVPPGNYTITITDDVGGSQIYMITVSATAMIPVITLVREITCFNFSNGRIEVGAFNGVHPISILWENLLNPPYRGSGYLQNDGDVYLLNSLPVGQYVITLIDNIGCITMDTIELTATPIVIDAVTTNATCLGTTDGSVSISFSGGRPYNGGIYEITPGWGGGTFMNTSPIMSAPVFGPGDYWVEVCDSINNCCVRDTFTVGADVVITADLLPSPPSCAGQNNAGVRVIGLTNGAIAGPYSIQLFDTNKVAVQPPIMNVTLVQFNNLAPGTYFVVIKEGMCRSDTIPVVLPTTPPITINVLSVTPSGCIVGQNSGTISVAASGGTPNYSYAWDGGAVTGPMVSNLSSGNHFLTVTDANGCTRTLTVSVPQATGPVIDEIIATNIGCSGDDITLEVVFVEGSSPVTDIQWSNGDTTAVITGVTSGLINVTIRDSLFCFDIASFDVPEMAMILIDSVQLENPTCGGDADGQFAVFVSAGTEPYTYYWSTGDTTAFNLIAGLSAGIYSVTIVDSDTCDVRIDTTIMLSDPPIPTFAFSAIDSTTCFNTCDGAATLTPAGGVPGFPYMFMWDSGHTESGMQSTAMNLCPGYQRVIITQDNLCFYEDSVFIPAPDPVGIDTLALQDVSCFGGSDGSILVTGIGGGSGTYQYVWSVPGVGPMLSGITAGDYGLTVTDGAGCTSVHMLSISEPDSLYVQIDSAALRPISCNFANSGSIALTVEGGNGGYIFNWNPNVSSDYVANGVSAGYYQITVTDASGCTDTTSILMTGPAPVAGFLPMIEDPICFGSLSAVTVDSASGGNGGYTWSINGGEPHELDSIVMLPGGIYNIITQDSTGCRDTIQIILNNPPPIEIVVLPEDPILDLGDSVLLQVLVQGNLSPVDSVLWTSNGALSCNDCTEPFAMNVIPTIYTVTVWDSNGCSASLDVLVDVNNRREVFIPNIFSPNFDGRNDQLILYTGQGITGIPSIRIFDRWGELMAEQRDLFPQSGGIIVWDGTFQNKMMMPGVYVYVIQVSFADNQVLTYRGDVTLVR